MTDDHQEPIQEQIHDLEIELATDTTLLAQAMGGRRGVIESGLPSLVFIVVYLISGKETKPSLIAALAVGLGLAGARLARRSSIQQVVSGLLGLALSAYLTARSAHAQAFYLPGIIKNAIYGVLTLVSIFLRRPLIGYMLGGIKGDLSGWLQDPELRAKYSTVTWIWSLVFLLRVALMYPLYLAGQTTILGVLSMVLSWPLFALAIYASYLVLNRPSGKSS